MNEDQQIENPQMAEDVAEATGAAGAAEDALGALESRLSTLEDELATAKQDVLYAHAETQNVRRRLEKELIDARAYAATAFARDVLSVSDNLTRALAAIPADLREDEKMKGLVTGLEATGRELESVFRKNGIERIEAIGQALDPNKHQAMIEMPSADAAPGTIVQEMQAGYMIKDRLLRPALVAVAKAPE
ncbi:nucleotide exchange factor GrpE [Sphingobium aquiterrae]|uniref:nucleotide exchange factor GrpE n=1 Tax=Sphingobium aquiterrae TaxID=2038656 RepID=UPI0030194B8F